MMKKLRKQGKIISKELSENEAFEVALEIAIYYKYEQRGSDD